MLRALWAVACLSPLFTVNTLYSLETSVLPVYRSRDKTAFWSLNFTARYIYWSFISISFTLASSHLVCLAPQFCTLVTFVNFYYLFILNDTFQLEKLTNGQFSTSLVLSLLFISFILHAAAKKTAVKSFIVQNQTPEFKQHRFWSEHDRKTSHWSKLYPSLPAVLASPSH